MKIRHAFTLIELMIVVAIIAFLSTVAIPQCFKYQARARQAEVAVYLASLHTAQLAYHAQNGEYSTNLGGDGGIGWKPEGYKGGGSQEKFYYSYGFNNGDAQEGTHFFTGKMGASKDSLAGSSAEKNGFIARAAADLLGKNKLDIWQIDQDRTITHVQNGID
jgi:prepilin-type N-terminal cleavage/methylation domain-containing protein